MKIIAAVLLCLIYTVIVICAGAMSGPSVAPWFRIALAVLFLLTYWRFVRRQLAIPLIVIFFVTFIFPFAALIAIGLPVHGSFMGTVDSLIADIRINGLLWGLEPFMPTFFAATTGLFLRYD